MKIEEQKIICVQCMKSIKPKEHFIELTEWNNGKLLKLNRIHYSCWERKIDTTRTIKNLSGIASSLFENLETEGIVKKKDKEFFLG